MKCCYCHEDISDTQAYSMNKIQGNETFWHYLCYVKQERMPYFLTEKEKDFLIKNVISFTPVLDGVALEAVRSLGYGK